MSTISERGEMRDLNLVLYGERFLATFDTEQGAQDMVDNLFALGKPCSIRPYGVHISSYDPRSGDVTDWHKVFGWSVWAKPEVRMEG